MKDKYDIKSIKNNLIADLRAFVARAGFTDVTFGLSGGMDSALVLALACEALGPRHVHTMMMKAEHTSQLSIDLANELAKNFGNYHETIDIQPLVDAVNQTLLFVPKKGVTMENIQARVRGILCMTYSNEFGRMVLACSNKSEIMTGYCTLYGDTCGAVFPLGDLYKTQVYEMAELYPQIPRAIITRPATAELSPGQLDSDSLPPYEILDPILQDIERGDPMASGAIKHLCLSMEFKRAQMPPVIKVR